MPRYRKKPVVIEAVRFDGSNSRAIMAWAASHGVEITEGVGPYEGRASDVLRIPTTEGVMVIGDGGWVIRGVKGEFYPCQADIFEATYEPADAGGVR